MEISKEVLIRCAENLMFELTDEGLEKLYNEFDHLVNDLNGINEIKSIDEEEEMTFPYVVFQTYMAEDEFEQPYDSKEMLKNSGKVFANQISVPKVVQ